jgi:hypothetical protein
MSRLIAFAVVLGAVLVSGAASGFQIGRWGGSRALQDAAARLDKIPRLGGDWEDQSAELPERVVVQAELEGYAFRRYLNRRTGTMVSVLLVCGRPGPISVHTPEVCYGGQGYAVAGRPKSHTVQGEQPFRFQVLDLKKDDVATPGLLRVFLSWGSRGAWTVPARPRFAFFTRPYLYKLYVTREIADGKEPVDGDPCAEIIKELMPRLQETLFGDA